MHITLSPADPRKCVAGYTHDEMADLFFFFFLSNRKHKRNDKERGEGKGISSQTMKNFLRNIGIKRMKRIRELRTFQYYI